MVKFIVDVVSVWRYPPNMKLNEKTGIGSWAWALFSLLGLVIGIVSGDAAKNLSVMYGFTLWTFASAVLLIAVVTASCVGIKSLAPFTTWSIFRLFGKESSGNVSVAPLKIPYFSAVFFAFFVVNLPYLAMVEERIFREGTSGWKDAIVRSLLFGFVHCLVGVPLYAGAALSLAGLWFSFMYFKGGVEASALHHATYNLIWAALVAVILVANHIEHWKGTTGEAQRTTM